jgi:hypothetical protein
LASRNRETFRARTTAENGDKRPEIGTPATSDLSVGLGWRNGSRRFQPSLFAIAMPE